MKISEGATKYLQEVFGCDDPTDMDLLTFHAIAENVDEDIASGGKCNYIYDHEIFAALKDRYAQIIKGQSRQNIVDPKGER
jgi:hypothetical protein